MKYLPRPAALDTTESSFLGFCHMEKTNDQSDLRVGRADRGSRIHNSSPGCPQQRCRGTARHEQDPYRLRLGNCMPHYRIYILDQYGDLKGAVGLDCADDETAKERVKALLTLLNGHAGELWRLVAGLELENPPTTQKS
jgi:hypothetical protein